MIWDFPLLLRRYRERASLSCNELARAVGCDPSYISRLERGEREPPRRRVVEALAVALQLNVPDTDQLLTSAGYTPTDWDRRLARLERLEVERKELLAILTRSAESAR